MRDDPPVTPVGATLVPYSTQGPRVPPGTYTVRLTKGGHPYSMPVVIGLDRRATFKVADRMAQYAAAKRVSEMFGRMSKLAARIVSVRDGARARAESLAANDPLGADLKALGDHADALRKLIVATTEGGAITGEERLRENLDYAYGAIMSVEDRPTAYQLARVDALEHELRDVEASFDALSKGELANVNAKLKKAGAEVIAMADIEQGSGGGGPIRDVANHMLGLRLLDFGVLQSAAEDRE
jgi:hypothetical protein